MKGYSSAVIVESRPGASGRIALEGLKSSVADGSAMTLTPAAMIALFPHIYKSLRYDPFVDFIPVTMICRFPRPTSQMPIEQIAEANPLGGSSTSGEGMTGPFPKISIERKTASDSLVSFASRHNPAGQQAAADTLRNGE